MFSLLLTLLFVYNFGIAFTIGGIGLLVITLRNLRRKLFTLGIACLLLVLLVYGVPHMYSTLSAQKDEEFRTLDEPLRVETTPSAEEKAQWFNIMDQE